MIKQILAATAALTLAAPLAAAAQEAPSYAQVASADEQIRGRIETFDGAYSLTVRDERGFVDDVQLHQGTIINPTGLTLAPGMVVSIIGYDDGPVLAANEIDTPYVVDAGIPYYGGHPWDYYGPEITLGFFFGNTGWWHPNYFAGNFHYDGGARVYTNIRLNIDVTNRGYGYGYRATQPVVYRPAPPDRESAPVATIPVTRYHEAAPVATIPVTRYHADPLPGPGFRNTERVSAPVARYGGYAAPHQTATHQSAPRRSAEHDDNHH
jgi:hypothetical protein